VLVGDGLIEAAGVAVAVGGAEDWVQDESSAMQRAAIVQMTLARCLNIRYPYDSLFKIIY
jgi:hypothetical protein